MRTWRNPGYAFLRTPSEHPEGMRSAKDKRGRKHACPQRVSEGAPHPKGGPWRNPGYARLRTNDALVPPKPKLLLTAYSMLASRAVCGT